MARPTPPVGYVHLILFDYQALFYLEVPIDIVGKLCLKPCKYLRYLGWCVLGVEGSLTLKDGDQEDAVNLQGELIDQGVYCYRLPPEHQDILLHAVDPEVIGMRSQVPSQTTGTREDFRMRVVERDGQRCVWSGLRGSDAMHIIPFSRGEEWFQLLMQNRPNCGDQNLQNCTVNDPRNGIMGAKSLHLPYFESRDAVVLKTPNAILEMIDVPPKAERDISDHTWYPSNSRYTLQWLLLVDRHDLHFFPNNTDAAFASLKPKPAEMLLHYNYGAAAVKHWGRNIDVLTNRPNVPRPSASQAAPLGPSRVIGDQTKTTGKLAEAGDQAGRQLSSGNGGGGSAVAGGHSEKWDEDDVMLFFWGNTKAATERRAKREREQEEKICNWRAGIAG